MGKQARPTVVEERQVLGLERLVFFSDAVMAIAITLLVIDIKVPEVSIGELPDALAKLTPRLVSFFISFAVVSIYWRSHHWYFSVIRRCDAPLIALNLVFLLCIALMPFVAGLLGQYGIQPLVVMIYGGAVAATGFAICAMWWYASRGHRLVDPDLDSGWIRARTAVTLVVPCLFLVSIPVSALNAWAGLGVWWVSPLVATGVQRWVGGNRSILRVNGTTGSSAVPSSSEAIPCETVGSKS